MRTVSPLLVIVLVAVGCSDDADSAELSEPSQETTSTGGPITTETPPDTEPPPVSAPVDATTVLPCPYEVIPDDTSSDENGIRPFPTYVPQYHFEGAMLDEVQCIADRREGSVRVWMIDGEEVAPEAAEGAVINLAFADGVVTVAGFSPSPDN